MKKILFRCFIFLALAIQPIPDVLAADAVSGTPSAPAYADFSSVPEPLQRMMNHGGVQGREQFVATVLQLIRVNGRTKQALDQQDIDLIRARDKRTRQLGQAWNILRYDMNFDRVVTAQEVGESLTDSYAAVEQGDSPRSQARIDTMVAQIMTFDRNGDGNITWEEMIELPPQLSSRTASPRDAILVPLLGLDPDGDGKLTAAELEALALRAFRTADKDNDGFLSKEELEIVRGQKADGSVQDPASACALPLPTVDEKIVFISAREGRAVSNVTVAGQKGETTTIPVDIMNGPEKFYFIAASAKPVIWDFTGNVRRLSRLGILGPMQDEQKKIAGGVIGIAPDKVFFGKGRGCLPSDFEVMEYRGQRAVEDHLRAIFKRNIDVIGGKTSMGHVQVSASQLLFEPKPSYEGMKIFDPPIPEGLDPDIWIESLLLGENHTLTDLKGRKIISDTVAEPYRILPGYAGVAQLVHDGALVRLGTQRMQLPVFNTVRGSGPMMSRPVEEGGFLKIVKEIPYYPVGIGREYDYVLGKGVKPPEGNTSACVMSEATGGFLLNEGGCRAVTKDLVRIMQKKD